MKRSLGRVSLAVAVAASAVVLPASLASATTTPATATATTVAAGLPGCPETSLCGWSGSSFTGQVTTFPPGGGCLTPPFPLRSAANTWKGGGVGIPVVLAVYSGKNCTGMHLASLPRGASAPNLPGEGHSVMSVW
ncbi:hypothetical protein OHR68_28055 [Spirillospora sp. NBC_00431]